MAKKMFRVFLLALLLFVPAVLGFASGQVVDRIDTVDKAVAITVEDVDNKEQFEEIIALCKAENVHVTFFVSGEVLNANKATAKSVVEAGHEFGNHGLKREYWGNFKNNEIITGLTQAEKVLLEINKKPSNIIRPPYNYYEKDFIEAAASYSDHVVIRGINACDWTLTTPQAVVEKAMTVIKAGDVLNINMKSSTAKDSLPKLIKELKSKGFKILSVSELLSYNKPVKDTIDTHKYPFKVIYHGSENKRMIALTFDDGGDRDRAINILNVLRNNNVHSTFFLVGTWIASNYDLVHRILEEGHEVSNHSFFHPQFTRLTRKDMIEEITATDNVFKEKMGRRLNPYFRPPYGEYNTEVKAVLQSLSYKNIILWDIDTLDWSGKSVEYIVSTVLSDAKNGSIVLFHLQGLNTAAALREIIPDLRARGYEFGTITQLLA